MTTQDTPDDSPPPCPDCREHSAEPTDDGWVYQCPCADEREEEECAEEAAEFAKANVCLFLDSITVYDDRFRYAPTREDYEAGCREAYTENAVAAHNRHNASNYDELINGLEKFGRDRAYYWAIRSQVTEDIGEALRWVKDLRGVIGDLIVDMDLPWSDLPPTLGTDSMLWLDAVAAVRADIVKSNEVAQCVADHLEYDYPGEAEAIDAAALHVLRGSWEMYCEVTEQAEEAA